MDLASYLNWRQTYIQVEYAVITIAQNLKLQSANELPRSTNPNMTRSLTALLLTIFTVTLGACSHAPKVMDFDGHQAMQEISSAYIRVVQQAESQPNQDWHSGWSGNIWINVFDQEDRGLCHHWQKLVFEGISPVASRLGWEAIGININKGTMNEHHAVAVFDPTFIQMDELLKRPYSDKVYILDPWKRGKPDIYPLAQWVNLPWFKRKPAALERP